MMHDEREPEAEAAPRPSDDPEAPEADSMEQHEPVRPEEPRPSAVGDREANEADVLEQAEPAGVDDEDEYG